MNISKQIIVSVSITVLIGFSASVFSAEEPADLTGQIADSLLDRADQVKKGDRDARRISEELGKPNPGDLEEHRFEEVDNSSAKNVEQMKPETDPVLKKAPE